jgi:hypothetical protein
MNNEQRTWILRKPIEAWEYSSEELETQIPIYQYGKDDPELLTVMKDIWNDLFVEFNEVAIRDQVEDLVANAMHRDWRGTMEEITLENKDWPTSKELRESLVDRILEVTLGRKQ